MAGDGGDRPHRPRKRFGQHFLTDQKSLERIVEALAPEPTDTVVEIGPGRGALTDLLPSEQLAPPGDAEALGVLASRLRGDRQAAERGLRKVEEVASPRTVAPLLAAVYDATA